LREHRFHFLFFEPLLPLHRRPRFFYFFRAALPANQDARSVFFFTALSILYPPAFRYGLGRRGGPKVPPKFREIPPPADRFFSLI